MTTGPETLTWWAPVLQVPALTLPPGNPFPDHPKGAHACSSFHSLIVIKYAQHKMFHFNYFYVYS